MKFTHFIRSHKEDITNEWVKFAQDNIDGINELELVEVNLHVDGFYF